MELLVTLVIAGILSAVASPSIIGMFQQEKLKAAAQDLESALRVAQGNAIKYSQDCTVTIDNVTGTTTGNNLFYTVTGSNITDDRGTASTTDDIPRNCILETRNILVRRGTENLLNIKTSGAGQIIYDFSGEVAVASNQTIVIYNESTKQSKCIVISAPLALMRTGEYTNVPAIEGGSQQNNASISSTNCNNTENLRYDNNNY
ncbi:hypothetical protein GM3709_3438 [Geminocystis sp. NIES-3709]|nr:hypothetical protein GM3709_3438 [Geminocystis sp. NIES-3709]